MIKLRCTNNDVSPGGVSAGHLILADMLDHDHQLSPSQAKEPSGLHFNITTLSFRLLQRPESPLALASRGVLSIN